MINYCLFIFNLNREHIACVLYRRIIYTLAPQSSNYYYETTTTVGADVHKTRLLRRRRRLRSKVVWVSCFRLTPSVLSACAVSSSKPAPWCCDGGVYVIRIHWYTHCRVVFQTLLPVSTLYVIREVGIFVSRTILKTLLYFQSEPIYIRYVLAIRENTFFFFFFFMKLLCIFII